MTEKKRRKIIAARHLAYIKDNLEKENKHLIQHTRVIEPYMIRQDTPTVKPNVLVCNKDTVTTIMMNRKDLPDVSITALNFASFSHPGGGFLRGSKAQEEDLCHASNLYVALESKEGTWYEQNKERRNNGLYDDTALYSKDVLFEKDGEQFVCNIISCAAPNCKLASKTYTRPDIFRAYRERVQFIFDITNSNILILGAWGCGAFGNDPRDAALAFQSVIQFGRVHSPHIIFPIPDDETYQIFKRRLQ